MNLPVRKPFKASTEVEVNNLKYIYIFLSFFFINESKTLVCASMEYKNKLGSILTCRKTLITNLQVRITRGLTFLLF